MRRHRAQRIDSRSAEVQNEKVEKSVGVSSDGFLSSPVGASYLHHLSRILVQSEKKMSELVALRQSDEVRRTLPSLSALCREKSGGQAASVKRSIHSQTFRRPSVSLVTPT